jgi:integrase
MARTTGVVARHGRSCRSRAGGRCNCAVTFEAWVWVARDGKKVFKRFRTEREARSWRASATTAVERHELRAHRSASLREAAEAWLEKAEAGEIRNRSRAVYKPSVLRGYRHDLEAYVLPDLGARRLSDISRHDVQALVDALVADGLSGSKVRNVVVAVKAVWRRQLRDGAATVDPTVGLELPALAGPRDRADPPPVFEELVAALTLEHRALWSTAFYAGLRRGELRGLRWDDVELHRDRPGGTIHVVRGWDDREGEIPPKSRAGARLVPVPTHLRKRLLEHQVATGRREGFVFGSSPSTVFAPTNTRRLALKAWRAANEERAAAGLDPLVPVGLHESRHGWKTWLRAAGVPRELRDEFAGHADHSIGARYEHTGPDDRDRAIALMDAHLARELATGAQTGGRAAGTA